MVFSIFEVIMLFLPVVGAKPFDSQHCASKCELLFSRDTEKKSSCVKLCTQTFTDTTEKVIYDDKYYVRKVQPDIPKCLANCSQNLDRSTDFRTWSKCRKSCINLGNQNNFFDEKTCNNDCERYWSGTIHLDSCKKQCREFTTDKGKRPSFNDRGRFHLFYADR